MANEEEDYTYDLNGNLMPTVPAMPDSNHEEFKMPSQMKKIDWSKMGTLFLPIDSIVFTEKGSEVAIEERVKILLANVVAHGIAIFDLLSLYNLKFIINPPEVTAKGVAGISVSDNGEAQLGLNSEMKGDWIKYLNSTPNAEKLLATIKSRGLENITENDIAEVLLVGFIAHEIYHIRQFYQDFDYFLDALKDNFLGTNGNILDQFENYDLSQSERSARAFAIKYLRKLVSKLKEFNFLRINIEVIECLIENMMDYEVKITGYSVKLKAEKRKADASHAYEQMKILYPYLKPEDQQNVLAQLRSAGVDVSPLLALPPRQ